MKICQQEYIQEFYLVWKQKKRINLENSLHRTYLEVLSCKGESQINIYGNFVK